MEKYTSKSVSGNGWAVIKCTKYGLPVFLATRINIRLTDFAKWERFYGSRVAVRSIT